MNCINIMINNFSVYFDKYVGVLSASISDDIHDFLIRQ